MRTSLADADARAVSAALVATDGSSPTPAATLTRRTSAPYAPRDQPRIPTTRAITQPAQVQYVHRTRAWSNEFVRLIQTLSQCLRLVTEEHLYLVRIDDTG